MPSTFVILGMLVSILLAPAPAVAKLAKPLASIPFETYGNLIVMQLTPDHLPTLTLVFDTGSSNTVIDASTARRLDLEVEKRPIESQGAGGRGQSWRMHETIVFQVGEARIEADGITVIDLVDLSERVGLRLDGIIGGDVLNSYIVRIDYESRRLDLLPADALASARGGLPIDFRHGIPTMTARVSRLDGRAREGRFYIDTGASRSAVLSAHFLRDLQLPEPGAPRVQLISRGAYQSFPTQVTRIGKLDLGPFEIARPTVLLSGARGGILSDRKTAGVIGGGALRRFTVTIDTRARRLYLEPNAAFSEPDDFDASGLQLQAEGPGHENVVARGVIPESPAAERGIREGDRVVALDGQMIDGARLEWLRVRLREVGARVTVEIERDGRRRDVHLELRRLL